MRIRWVLSGFLMTLWTVSTSMADDGQEREPSNTAGCTCTDNNPCTTDTCFLCIFGSCSSGCLHTPVPNGTLCNDGSACTSSDHCSNGVCTGTWNCNDGNVCTFDFCSGFCIHLPVGNGTACNDSRACTTNDHCSNGTCSGTSNCNDGNVCTADTCTLLNGCVFTDNTAECDDDDACTSDDLCISGTCRGEHVFGLDEWRQFTECYDGVGVEVEVGCECSDLDADGDVDLLDVAEFMRLFNGN